MSLQQQARALGDPTRHAVFRYIADQARPVGVAELTSHFGLNHNAIRQHLAKLTDAALVVESTAVPSGRGRPRLEYTVDPLAESRWDISGPYERLSVLLTEIIRSGSAPLDVGRRAGRRHELASTPGGTAVVEIARAMAREGFDPEVRERGTTTEIVLRNCPFEAAAVADPDTICALHLGMAEGIAEGTDVVIDELIPRDPRAAGCRLRLHREGAAPSG